jgi:hypothetical protein
MAQPRRALSIVETNESVGGATRIQCESSYRDWTYFRATIGFCPLSRGDEVHSMTSMKKTGMASHSRTVGRSRSNHYSKRKNREKHRINPG